MTWLSVSYEDLLLERGLASILSLAGLLSKLLRFIETRARIGAGQSSWGSEGWSKHGIATRCLNGQFKYIFNDIDRLHDVEVAAHAKFFLAIFLPNARLSLSYMTSRTVEEICDGVDFPPTVHQVEESELDKHAAMGVLHLSSRPSCNGMPDVCVLKSKGL